MKLAKPQVDIGLSTKNPDPMLAFWHNWIELSQRASIVGALS
jgi:hypothetical protein